MRELSLILVLTDSKDFMWREYLDVEFNIHHQIYKTDTGKSCGSLLDVCEANTINDSTI
jgi:hypothetical protein